MTLDGLSGPGQIQNPRTSAWGAASTRLIQDRPDPLGLVFVGKDCIQRSEHFAGPPRAKCVETAPRSAGTWENLSWSAARVLPTRESGHAEQKRNFKRFHP